MRQIPTEVATLLKSRSMIGANKPSWEVYVNDIITAENIHYYDYGTENVSWIEGFSNNNAVRRKEIDHLYIGTTNINYINGGHGHYRTLNKINLTNIIKIKVTFGINSLIEGRGNIAIAISDHILTNYLGDETYTLVKWYVATKNIDNYTIEIDVSSLAGEYYLTIEGSTSFGTVTSSTTKIYAIWGEGVSLNLSPKSINISRNKNMAGSLNLAIDNKNGEWSPDNTIHQNVLFPNSEITVKQGYGSNLIQTFTGLIDRIEMTTFPQELKLSVRDKLKLALDQTISGIGTHTLTYDNQSVEAIFKDLCTKSGLATGTIEATGLNITKTFSWETYADCFSFLADLVGFEYGADETGVIYFRKDTTPTEPTIAYEFKEGEDIISLGYTIDDNDLYSKVVVYGKDENDNVLFAQKEYVSKDYYKVLQQKFMKIDVSEASTVEQLQAIADRAEMLMRSRVREVSFAAIAVPWLQVGDIVKVIESSTTISELYRITDLSTNMDSSGYTMQITGYHHSV